MKPNSVSKKEQMSFKDSFIGLKKILVYSRSFAPTFVVAILLASVGAVLTILGPNYLGDITDLLQEGVQAEIMGTGEIDLGKIGEISLLLILLYCLSILFSYAQSVIMGLVSSIISKRLRKDINDKINRVPLKSIESKEAGDLMSLVTNDVDLIGQSLSNSIASFIASFVQFIGVTIMMFLSEWRMALTAIGATLIGLLGASVILLKSQKYFTAQQAAVAKVNGHVEEIYGAHSVVRANNAVETNEANFERLNDKLYEMNWKSQFFGNLTLPLMNFISNFGYVAVCVVGALLINENAGTLALITKFMIYIRLFSSPLTTIAQDFPYLQQSAAAGKRVFAFLEEEEMSDESSLASSIDPKEVKGQIDFDHVSFGYEEGKIIIKEFSAHVKPGQKVAIVGPTGAGKTTLVSLLMRFYDIWGGSIKIDGVPINELKRENVHSLFGMVLQDTWLFEGTIRDNLKFNHPEIEDGVMKGDAKICGVDHFIKALPHGYHTVLDNHLEISAGQKQLLTITRAMIQNAPMLILDEATSSVDTRTELVIQKAMDELTKGRTSFIIAHRLSTIKNADLILVLKDGNIVESGNHESLLEKNGFYAELYNSQFASAQ